MDPKIAQSKTKDSLQQHLRSRKAVWNSACSAFIARLNAFKPHLIAFKRGLNGRGDQKAGLPISDIKNPLPGEVSSYLGNVSAEFSELANTFSELVSEANSIVQEQTAYSERRRKPIVHSSQNMPIIKSASSPVSRFWANISALFSSAPFKYQRLSMLKIADSLFKKLVDLEDAVLSRGNENISDVFNHYLSVSNQVAALSAAFKQLYAHIEKANLTKQDGEPDAPPPEDKPPVEEPQKRVIKKTKLVSFDKLKRDVLKMTDLGLAITDANAFMDLIQNLKNEKNINTKNLIKDRLLELYDELYAKTREIIAQKTNKPIISANTPFDEFLGLILAHHHPTLIKESSNFFVRLLKEYRQRFGTKEPSTAARMEIFGYIKIAKRQVDQIMDMLESSDIDANKLITKINEIEELIIKMNISIQLLNILYKDKYYMEHKKMKEPNIDPAHRFFTRQLRRDVDRTRG